MYTVLDKDTIEMEIVPLIPKTKRGFPPTVPLVEIVNAILYKLKTGTQWNQLPVKALFGVSNKFGTNLLDTPQCERMF